jgi:hypothetical protein
MKILNMVISSASLKALTLLEADHEWRVRITHPADDSSFDECYTTEAEAIKRFHWLQLAMPEAVIIKVSAVK